MSIPRGILLDDTTTEEGSCLLELDDRTTEESSWFLELDESMIREMKLTSNWRRPGVPFHSLHSDHFTLGEGFQFVPNSKPWLPFHSLHSDHFPLGGGFPIALNSKPWLPFHSLHSDHFTLGGGFPIALNSKPWKCIGRGFYSCNAAGCRVCAQATGLPGNCFLR